MFKVQIKVNRRISSYLPHTSSPSKLKNPPAPATRPALSPLVLVSVPATQPSHSKIQLRLESPSTSVPERAPASYKATDTAQGKIPSHPLGLAISVIGQKYGYVPSSGYENQQSCCVDRFHLRLGRVKSLLPSSFQQYSFKPYPSQEMQMMEMELEKIQESAMEQLSMGKVMSYKDQPSSLLAFQEMIKQSQSHHHPTFYFLLCQQHRIQQLEANLSVSLEERIVLGRLASFLLLPSSKVLSFLLSLGTSSATYLSVIF